MYSKDYGEFGIEERWELQRNCDLALSTQTSLHEAETLQTAEYMIAEGHDMNLQTIESLSTPLVAALKKGKLEIVQYLINLGCNTDICTIDGHSPLHIAVITNNEKSLRTLLNCTNVNRQPIDILGQTLLHNAVQYNHINTLLPLLLAYASND